MIRYEIGYKAYVAEDGNYGVDTVVTFDYDYFYAEYPKAWEILDEIHDSSRVDFIVAVLDQDEDMLVQFQEDYEFRLTDVLKS